MKIVGTVSEIQIICIYDYTYSRIARIYYCPTEARPKGRVIYFVVELHACFYVPP